MYRAATRIPESQLIPLAALQLSGNALIWWEDLLERGTAPRTWDNFSQAILQQFVVLDQSRKARDEIAKLVQKTSVEAYYMEFIKLLFDIQDYAEAEKYHQFMRGLKSHIRLYIDQHHPNLPFMETVRLAQRYDEVTQAEKRSTFTTPQMKLTQSFEEDEKSFDEPTRRLQQMERDKSNIECFNCGKKGHMAKECFSKRNEGNRPPWKAEKKMTFRQARKMDEVEQESQPQRQMNQISAMQFETKINKKQIPVMIDSGADGSFFPEHLAKQAGVKMEPRKNPYEIKLPSGQTYQVSTIARKVPLDIQGYKEEKDFDVVEMPTEQIILGTDWLHERNPQIDWKKGEVNIDQKGTLYTLKTKRQKGIRTVQMRLIFRVEYGPWGQGPKEGGTCKETYS